MPAYFDILLGSILVWDFQDKFSSEITPIFLTSHTHSISILLISRVGINPVMSFWIRWNTMNLVFIIFKVSLFNVNQSCASESSLFRVWFTFVLVMGIKYSVVLINRLLSSTSNINKKNHWHLGDHLFKLETTTGQEWTPGVHLFWYISWMMIYCDLIPQTELCLLDNYWTSQGQHLIFHNILICSKGFHDLCIKRFW